MRLSPMKAIVLLLFLGNLVFMGINAMKTWDLYKGDASKRIGETKKWGRTLKVRREQLKADLQTVSQGKAIIIEKASIHFANQATAANLAITQYGITIPNTPKTKKGKNFNEDSWQIGFNSRDRTVSFKQVAKLANLIESTTPGFQIKEIDLGQRSAAWGDDAWKANAITVRRIYRKQADN